MARVLAGTPSEGGNRAMVIAAVLFAAIAAVLLFVALQNRSSGEEGVVATSVDVVVAARSIEPNTRINADMLELQSISSGQVLTGAYNSSESLAQLVGLAARFPIAAGEQITPGKLGLDTVKDENDLALVLDPGMRGFAVEATEVSAVGGLILPGNFVDVIVVINYGDRGFVDNRAFTILEKIEVLSVAQEAQEPVPAIASGTDEGATDEAAVAQGIRGQRPDDVERQPGARSVTLAVTPAQARLLALLQAGGTGQLGDIQIVLSLRSAGDEETAGISETRLPQELLP